MGGLADLDTQTVFALQTLHKHLRQRRQTFPAELRATGEVQILAQTAGAITGTQAGATDKGQADQQASAAHLAQDMQVRTNSMEPQAPQPMLLLRPADMRVIQLIGICEITPASLSEVSRLM